MQLTTTVEGITLLIKLGKYALSGLSPSYLYNLTLTVFIEKLPWLVHPAPLPTFLRNVPVFLNQALVARQALAPPLLTWINPERLLLLLSKEIWYCWKIILIPNISVVLLTIIVLTEWRWSSSSSTSSFFARSTAPYRPTTRGSRPDVSPCPFARRTATDSPHNWCGIVL